MWHFSSGLSAIRATQVALDTLANNIANASTPGYHRRDVGFQERPSLVMDGLRYGTGTDVAAIRRFRDGVVEGALTRVVSDLADATQQLDALQQIESLFATSDGSIHERFQTFFNELERLGARPDDRLQRQIVIGSADSLAGELRHLAGQLQALSESLDREIEQTVGRVNAIGIELAELNKRIRLASALGQEPHDLRDRRDSLVNELADLIDVVTQSQSEDPPVLIAGGNVPIGNRPLQLSVSTNGSDDTTIVHPQLEDPLRIHGGKLGALLASRNGLVPAFAKRLNDLTSAMMQAMDDVHSTGVGLNGPFDVLTGQRAVSDTSIPLAEALEAFRVRAGDLSVSVFDASGASTVHTIQINPSSASLQDIAASLSAIDHLQAVVNNTTGTLSVIAEPGFTFAFTDDGTSTPSTGLLTVLGLNTFFVGATARDIAVNPVLLGDPEELALSRTGVPDDEANLGRLLAIRDEPLIASRTLLQHLGDIASFAGEQVRELNLVRDNLQAVHGQLTMERESVSGVDPNEEIVRLLQYQRSYQAAARVISTVNETLGDLLRMVE